MSDLRYKKNLCRVENNFRLHKASAPSIVGFEHRVMRKRNGSLSPWVTLCTVCFGDKYLFITCHVPDHVHWQRQSVETRDWIWILVLPLLTTGPYTSNSPFPWHLISFSVKWDTTITYLVGWNRNVNEIFRENPKPDTWCIAKAQSLISMYIYSSGLKWACTERWKTGVWLLTEGFGNGRIMSIAGLGMS